MVDVYLNEVFVGECPDGKSFVANFKKSRRSGEVSTDLNIRLDLEQDSIYIEGSPGRCRRPLVVAENGKCSLTPDVVKKLVSGEMNYDDLVSQGIIEYVDALEEEDCLVAMYTTELTNEHTHVELSPILMFGLNTGTVPFSNFDEPGRLMRGQKTVKQAVGT